MSGSRHTPPRASARAAPVAALAVSALGVVYGDIGTNPLFAMREAFTAEHHVEIIEANVLGIRTGVWICGSRSRRTGSSVG
jgi:KUP system potassium uptake protein